MKNVSLITTLLVIGGYVLAWSGPTLDPVGNNIPAPLNVGDLTYPLQSASGSLNVSSFSVSTGYYKNSLQVGGIISPTGTIKYIDGNQGLNKILTSNASGAARWVSTSSLGIGVGDIGSSSVVYVPLGSCYWSGYAFADGVSCVSVKLETGTGFGDYTNEYYWEYYTCTNGHWVFNANNTLVGGAHGSFAADTIQTTGSIKCVGGSSVPAVLQGV